MNVSMQLQPMHGDNWKNIDTSFSSLMKLPKDLSALSTDFEEIYENKDLRSTFGPSFSPLLSALGKIIDSAKFLSFDVKDLCLANLTIDVTIGDVMLEEVHGPIQKSPINSTGGDLNIAIGHSNAEDCRGDSGQSMIEEELSKEITDIQSANDRHAERLSLIHI